MASKSTPPIHRYVGRIIHMIRKDRGMRQSELATLTGLKQPNLSRIENGLVVPRRSTLQKVATALDVEVSDLLSPESAREAEVKLGAALSPKNAGLLLAGKLSPVPLYHAPEGWAVSFDKDGQPSGAVELNLQLPPVPGRSFGLRVADDSMLSDPGGPDSFRPGEILVFSDRPEAQSGDYAYVVTETFRTFRRVFFEDRQAPLHLVPRNKKHPEESLSRGKVRSMWKLTCHIRAF